jgi:N-alpha-acetyltransferase 15/16, NatA auxiliary subunit
MIISLKKILAASLPEKPSGPVGEILGENILPEGLSVETYHSQFLQKHSHSASALLSCAQAAQILEAPKEEVESIIFSSLEEPVEGSIEVFPTCSNAIRMLTSWQFFQNYLQLLAQLARIQSERVEEFREKCDTKFELSTVFKTKLEKEVLKRRALTITEDTPGEDKTEIVN